MKRIYLMIPLLALFITNAALAQSTDSLNRLAAARFPAFYSKGQEVTATGIAAMIQRAISFHRDSLNFTPDITLMVLDSADWKIHSTKGAVYGMPHYADERKTLIVAAQDNPFWRSFLPPADKLPVGLRDPVIATYTGENGILSCRAFFDLLAIHELGHAFHIQAGLNMQRSWIGELFCNIFLHTYVAEKEPALLPALTLFPKMTVSAGAKGFKYTSLKDLHDNYNEIGMNHPRNYGWYQCRWHMAAADVYNTSGKKAVKKIWTAFRNERNKLDDKALPEFFDSSGNKAIAEMIRNWDQNIVL